VSGPARSSATDAAVTTAATSAGVSANRTNQDREDAGITADVEMMSARLGEQHFK